jgi:hypothetical protein
MKYIGLFVIFLLPAAGATFGAVWTLWRGLAFIGSRTAPGEIVGWKAVSVDADFDKPAFDRYAPIVRYVAHDGVARQTQFRAPCDQPVWPRKEGPVVRYRLWPRVVAEQNTLSWLLAPFGIFGFFSFGLVWGIVFGMDGELWRLAGGLMNWRP